MPNVGEIFWVKSKRTVSKFSKRKRNFLCCAHLPLHKAGEWNRKFHVAVVQQWLSNVQKSVMHVQSWFFANLKLLFFFCYSPSPLQKLPIVHLYDDIILLLQLESLRGLLSCANLGFCHWNLAGIVTKFEYERKNEKDSGRSSKMTPSCKWPIAVIQKFCYHGNVTSHFSSLLNKLSILASFVSVNKNAKKKLPNINLDLTLSQ